MRNKIGIVTELNLDDVNFGNHLQSYALNHYLSKQYPEKKVETLLISRRHEARLYASVCWCFMVTIKRCYAKLKRIIMPPNKGWKIDVRFKKFIQFARNYILINDEYTKWEQIKASDYKALIVGSDVVWQQSRGCIRKSRFLYFDSKQEANDLVRIAYAASFGINFIPKENVKIIKKCLLDFDAISVREKSAVTLLENIGLKNVLHVCDSTLLLSKEEWIELEKDLSFRDSSLQDISTKIMSKRYCFAYMLGQDVRQEEAIIRFCKKKGLCLLTVPYIKGYMTEGFGSSKIQRTQSEATPGFFGDICVMDCSPQEWIWLIHHAEYVVTDSFHGLVFSTIFSTKFIVLKRVWKIDMNIRMEDYLDFLDQNDKYLETEELDSLNTIDRLNWDFENMHSKMDVLITESKNYLHKALSDI